MAKSDKAALSNEAQQLMAALNGLAAEVMYECYKSLPFEMKLKLTKVIKDTQRVLDE